MSIVLLIGSDHGHYKSARAPLKVSLSGQGAALSLNVRYSLHPIQGALRELFRADLAVTTDYRNVLSEVLVTPYIDQVFPGFTDYQPARQLHAHRAGLSTGDPQIKRSDKKIGGPG
jgi:uncharacterized protein (DUF1501 family)